MSELILLFTDFGLEGPYLGQVMAMLGRHAPGVPIVNLFADVPACDPKAAACLLQATIRDVPAPSHCLAVVDPGVGTDRRALIVEADDRCYIGPDNGLFDRVVAAATRCRCWQIDYRPSRLSRTFHGRDLFAPVTAKLAAGHTPDSLGHRVDYPVPTAIGDIERVIYIDHFGNAMTGIDGHGIDCHRRLRVAGQIVSHAETFAAVAVGQAFWYVNALGLVEIAVNRGSACRDLGIAVGEAVDWALHD